MAKIYGPEELLEDVFAKNLCIGCGACVDLCPYFKSYQGKTAMLHPCDRDRGDCYALCPKAEVDLDELSRHMWKKPYDASLLGFYKTIIAARAGDRFASVSGSFQAGGAASAIMSFALASDVIDGAILTDRQGLMPISRLVTRAEEVIQYADSKYMTAPTVSALNQGIKDGYNRLGLVGTPCQVTAAAQLRTNPSNRIGFEDPINLILGLFCTWAVDARKLISFLSYRMDPEDIIKMDIPPPPADALEIETQDGKIQIPLEEIRVIVPKGCGICPDMTAEWADISIGNLEGDPLWNTLIIRTDKGEALINNAVDKGWLETKQMPEENLYQLKQAAANKKRKAFQKAKAEGLVNSPASEKHASLRLDANLLDSIIGGEEV